MKILMVSSYLPYPLFSGGHIRLFNLMRELSKKHKITLVCEKRDYQTEKNVKEVDKFCQKVIIVSRKKQWSALNILKTGFSFYPFLMVGHTNNRMKKEISEELKKNSYDLIHVETFYIIQNVPRTKLPLVLAEQNIEYLVYKRFVAQANFLLRPLLYLDIVKMRYWEEKFWRKVNELVVMSEEDKEKIGMDNVTIVPNGVDIEKFNPPAGGQNSKFQKREKIILFIGNFRWIQNRDAVDWLLKEIWPHFVRQWRTSRGKPKIKLWIVGKEIPLSFKNLGGPDIIFDEKAPDETSLIYQKADLLLAPIRVGGGTSFKILEAMASGVPVVTTPLGIEGIEARDNKEVLIAKDRQGLVGKTIDVLQNEDLYKKVVMNARILIEKKYDWRIIVKRLEEVYSLVTTERVL